MSDAAVRRIAVVTGTRAEWGLLECVCDAIAARPGLALEICAGGAHLVPLSDGAPPTIALVERKFGAVHRFTMQSAGASGRLADARAVGLGISALADIFARIVPDVVVVLGDRIEAFAAAGAASIGGIRVAHIHGGDRAEGIADEAMRHAITKLAHVHFAASEQSAERILKLGEERARIHLVGSPAVDGLASVKAAAGEPGFDFVFLMHPVGRSEDEEERDARAALDELVRHGSVLALPPNTDPGREGIARSIAGAAHARRGIVEARPNLAREDFVALLKHPRLRALVGNSSAGLIECAALGVRCINLGPRQSGRERADNVRDVPSGHPADLAREIAGLDGWSPTGRHPYLGGGAAARIAEVLATCDFSAHGLAKRNTY